MARNNRHDRVSTAAAVFFSTYNETGSRWRTHDGRQVPPWSEIDEAVRQKWQAVAARAITEIELAVWIERKRASRVAVMCVVFGSVIGALLLAVSLYIGNAL